MSPRNRGDSYTQGTTLNEKDLLAIRYKDPETGKWLGNRLQTETGDEKEACVIAIKEKESVLREHKEKISKKHAGKDGEAFYRMLGEYFAQDSMYLKDDSVNNKRVLPDESRRNYMNSIRKFLVPYFKYRGITSVKDINGSVYSGYSGYKLYLTNANLSKKSVNNNLSAFNRILRHHVRHELIPKLPYNDVDGEGYLRLTGEDRKNRAEKMILTPEMVKGIVPSMHDIALMKDDFNIGTRKPDRQASVLIASLGITMGLRPSEIGRIKVGDMKRIRELKVFYIEVQNEKISHFTGKGGEIRKMPVHPFLVDRLREFVIDKGKKKNDYLFGIPKMINRDGNIRADGFLNANWFRNAFTDLYEASKLRETLAKGNMAWKKEILVSLFDADAFKDEISRNNYSFYSLRHTFQQRMTAVQKMGFLHLHYFMGHIPAKMLDAYLHINKEEPRTFWKEWGGSLAEVQEQFFLPWREPRYPGMIFDERGQAVSTKTHEWEGPESMRFEAEMASLEDVGGIPPMDNENDDVFTDV